ncbi:MAG: Ig-like domain repeat protein, partial [Mycobacterium sp.]|nr:Ig-like domain repeat protein [Mycobacterium sp.]
TQQSCNATTDPNGNVSCTIASVDQPASSEPITTSFGGDSYDTASSTTTSATITEPTDLMVNSATSDFADSTTVSGVLTDSITNTPIANEPITFTLNGTETCTGTTDPTGTASCSITPGEPAATYTLTGSFKGDSLLPLQLTPASGSSNFVVTLEQTWLSYTGATTAQNGQPLVLSGVLTTDDPAMGAPINGRTVTFTLGAGSAAQSCSGSTNASGSATCTIASVSQSPGPIPVTAGFAGDGYYQMASAAATVNLPEGTQLTVSPGSGTYNGSTTVSATLVNTYTNQPVPNEPVTVTLNGTQPCTATTNGSGVASCAVSPNEPAGTYSLTASFTGDSRQMPQLLPTSGSNTLVVTQAPTTLSYTGTTSVTNGQPATLSGVLTTNEPSTGTDVAGRTVTFTIGSGSSLQSCTATTNASGAASCTIASVNQTSGTTAVSASYSGDSYYQSSTATSTVTVHTPTTLTVNAGTIDFADAGTVSAVLTNSV